MISLIWAMDKNGLIGKDNALPWRLPAELQYLKKTTMGHPIAMGRKTFESLGRPLPGRENMIITRNPTYLSEGCTVFHSLQAFVTHAQATKEEIFIMGGAEIYSELLDVADRLYVTKIDHAFEGDTYFPEYDVNEWTEIYREAGKTDEKNPYAYEYYIYERKNK